MNCLFLLQTDPENSCAANAQGPVCYLYKPVSNMQKHVDLRQSVLLLLLFPAISFCQNYTEHELDSLLAIQQAKTASNKALKGKPFPDFSYFSNGDTINNASLLGKTVFVNFWFEACPPCLAEFEALSEMYQLLRDDTNTAFITFTFESEEAIKKIREKHKLEYTILSVTKEECRRLNNQNGFPTSMIVDRTGKIQWFSTGGNLEREKVRKFIIGFVYPKILNMQ